MERNNEDIKALIELYALGELDEEKIPIVEEHLRQNPSAMSEVEEIRSISAAIASEKIEEMPAELAAATKSTIHLLIERDNKRIIFPLLKRAGRMITRPAFAAASAFIAITVCLLFIFLPNTNYQPTTIPGKGSEPTSTGIAATVDSDFGNYVAGSAEVFEIILNTGAEDFTRAFDKRKADNEIGKAMVLLENQKIIENPDRNSLVSDIESVWRKIKDYSDGKEGISFEAIRNEIIEKNIIKRVQNLNQGN